MNRYWVWVRVTVLDVSCEPIHVQYCVPKVANYVQPVCQRTRSEIRCGTGPEPVLDAVLDVVPDLNHYRIWYRT